MFPGYTIPCDLKLLPGHCAVPWQEFLWNVTFPNDTVPCKIFYEFYDFCYIYSYLANIQYFVGSSYVRYLS